MNTLVLDSNVVAKLFIDEPDSQQAINLIEHCVKNKITLLVPELFRYEIANILVRYKISLEPILDFFEEQINKIIIYENPSNTAWIKAEEIAKTGHKKSGFPSLYDSIYQAMAIDYDGLFITADKKHYVKTKEFGHIALLSDWEQLKQ